MRLPGRRGWTTAASTAAAKRIEINGSTPQIRTPPRKWGATDLAFDTGYRDGVTAGRYDRGRNSRPDFEATDAYRNGNHGYGTGYGERASYQEHYRTGFERGYRDGFGHRR
jgi:hypothetical protein